MSTQIACDHVIGHSGQYDDTRIHELSQFLPSKFWSFFTRATDIEERFNFCPLCGIKIDWDALEKEQKRLNDVREREETAEEDAKAEARDRALFAKRMRGKESETW